MQARHLRGHLRGHHVSAHPRVAALLAMADAYALATCERELAISKGATVSRAEVQTARAALEAALAAAVGEAEAARDQAQRSGVSTANYWKEQHEKANERNEELAEELAGVKAAHERLNAVFSGLCPNDERNADLVPYILVGENFPAAFRRVVSKLSATESRLRGVEEAMTNDLDPAALRRELAEARALDAAVCACGDHCQADGAACVTCAMEMRSRLERAEATSSRMREALVKLKAAARRSWCLTEQVMSSQTQGAEFDDASRELMDAEREAQAALAANAPAACATCNDEGTIVVGTPFSESDPSRDCPDCTPKSPRGDAGAEEPNG